MEDSISLPGSFLWNFSSLPCLGRSAFIRPTWLLYSCALLNGPKETCRSQFSSPHRLMRAMILLRHCKVGTELFSDPRSASWPDPLKSRTDSWSTHAWVSTYFSWSSSLQGCVGGYGLSLIDRSLTRALAVFHLKVQHNLHRNRFPYNVIFGNLACFSS